MQTIVFESFHNCLWPLVTVALLGKRKLVILRTPVKNSFLESTNRAESGVNTGFVQITSFEIFGLFMIFIKEFTANFQTTHLLTQTLSSLEDY